MGLSSANIANEGIQFCIFDSRRGQHEGQELDKILFFYPSECPYSSQLSVIGLCEGIITFTRIFSPEAACEVIEAERHSHVFYEAEPDIWMIMVVEKSKYAESVWRSEALRGVLKEIHSLFVMFHGSLKTLIDKQPSGEFVRTHLYYFFTDYLTDFTIGKKIQLPSFRECLKERGTVQMLTISRDMAIEIQSLVTVLGSPSGANTTYNSLILFQDLLVSTTLSPDDTANLFAYCVMRLSPHALSSSLSVNSWSYIRKSKSASNVSTVSAVCAASDGSRGTSHDASPGEQPRTVNVARPLQRDKWSKGGDGFLVTDVWGVEIGSSLPRTPTLWLQQTHERTYLCVYQYKNLTIALLIPVSSLINGEQGIAFVKNQLLENVSQKIVSIEEKLSRGWGGENAYHVSGYRYLLLDGDRNISRASPPTKVTTLSKDSLLALNKLREEVDLEKKRTMLDNPEHEKDFEACIRAKNNAWVIAKISRGRELYMALEKASETLMFASDAVEKFSNSGGNCQPLQVPFMSKLQQLKGRVLRVLMYNPSKFIVNIVGRFPLGNKFIALKVEDNEACEFALSLVVVEVMTLQVEVEQILVDHSYGDNLFTQICDSVVLEHRDEVQDASRRHLPMPNLHVGYCEGAFSLD